MIDVKRNIIAVLVVIFAGALCGILQLPLWAVMIICAITVAGAGAYVLLQPSNSS